MSPRAAGYIDLTFKAYKEDDQYVSECIELGVASRGDTRDEAFAAIADAVTLYLSTLIDRGEIDRMFRERGIEVHGGDPPDGESVVSVTARRHEFISPTAVRIPAHA
jgi:predicted RNase H-like HicB family nuclease